MMQCEICKEFFNPEMLSEVFEHEHKDISTDKLIKKILSRNYRVDTYYGDPAGGTRQDSHMALAAWNRALADYCVGLAAGPLSEEFPTEVDGKPLGDYLDWLRFSNLSTVTGLPAMSLPVGFMPDGMPMGIQLIGPNRGEGKLLAVARTIENMLALKNTPIDPVTHWLAKRKTSCSSCMTSLDMTI